jgi:hypothetical protein
MGISLTSFQEATAVGNALHGGGQQENALEISSHREARASFSFQVFVFFFFP